MAAITVYVVFGTLVGAKWSPPFADVWKAYVPPFLHFWYVATLLILLLLAPVLALPGRLIAIPIVLSVAAFQIVGVVTPVGSVTMAGVLMPSFLLGVVFARNRDGIGANTMSVALGAIAASAVVVLVLIADPVPDLRGFARRGDDLAWLGVIVALAIYMPRARMLEVVGSMSMAIYFYHVMASSMTRRGLEAVGVESVGIHLVLGVLSGVAVPMIVVLAMRHAPPLHRICLGGPPPTWATARFIPAGQAPGGGVTSSLRG